MRALAATVWGGLLVSGALAQQDVPAGIVRSQLNDGVTRFDRISSTQPAYWWQLLLEYFSWKPARGLPFRRSVALLTGVSRYQHLSPNQLAFVETDLTDLRNFLLTDGGFDLVLEVRGEKVTRALIERYMANEFASNGALLNKDDRLLFYYSGHGTDQAGAIGYLQFAKARDNDFYGDSILKVRDFQEWAQVIVAKHLLVVLDSCASGLGISVKGAETEAILKSLSGEGSGRILTAGYGKQKVYGVEGAKGYSVLTRAFINALRNGAGDSGFTTIDQAYGQIQSEASIFAAANGRKMNPQLGDLPRGSRTTDGTFVFLNRKGSRSLPPKYTTVLSAAPKASEDSANASPEAMRLSSAELAYESVKDSNDVATLRTFIDEYHDVPGALTLVATIRDRLRGVGESALRMDVTKTDATKQSTLAFGVTHRGTIGQRGGSQSYQLPPIRSGDVLFAHVFDCSARGGSPLSWKPHLALSDSTANVVADSSEYIETSLRGIQLQGGVKYSIALNDVVDDRQQGAGGSYSLFVQRVNEPERAVALKDGADQTAFINSCGQIDTYSFEARVGERIELSIVAGSKGGVYPKLELYDPKGNFLEEAKSYDGSGFHVPPPGDIELRATKTGRHTVLVRSMFNDKGPYRVALRLK